MLKSLGYARWPPAASLIKQLAISVQGLLPFGLGIRILVFEVVQVHSLDTGVSLTNSLQVQKERVLED